MKLVGLMPVRNEDWVLALSARIALEWCDELVILLHACTDRSLDICTDLCVEYRNRVYVGEVSGEWTEMQHRQLMLQRARERKATYIALIDADEILTGNLLDKAIFMQHNDMVLQLPGYNLRGGLNRYHSNGVWGNRWFSTAFKDSPDLHWGGDQFHAREPRGRKLIPYQPISQREGGIVHLWGASERRLIARHALYKCTERLRWPSKPVATIDKMYSWAIKGDPQNATYGTPETWTYANTPSEWLAPYAHWMKYLDVDAEPYQEAEVRRLVAEHGAEMFQGLDLFGVA